MARKLYNFDFSYITSRPKKEKGQSPLWCDFLELLCLIEMPGYITKGEAGDLIFNEGKGMIIPDDDSSSDDMDGEDDDTSPSPDDDIDVQLATMGSRNGQRSDKQEMQIVDWFNNLAAREESLGDLYPFNADATRCTLALKPDLTDGHKLYLFLVLASNLHLFSPALSTKITADFENICLEAQKLLFPLTLDGAKAQTHLFGKNPTGQGPFVGTIAEKFEKLASLIQAREVDTSFFRTNNSGDGGIDLVSIISFEKDNAFGLPLVLSQCACSYDDWKGKQDDHHPDNYTQNRLFDVNYLRLIYIPFFYRDQRGQWFDIRKIKLSIIDRLRLMKILLNQQPQSYARATLWADLVLAPDMENRRSLADSLAQAAA